MSTGTQALSGAHAIVGVAPKSSGFFQRMMRRVIEAQERKARTIVAGFLASQSDERLTELGYAPAEIKSIRRSPVGPVGWL